ALSAVIIGSSSTAFAVETDKISITNPYENVDWSNVNQYKTALHTHTNASDGDQTLRQSLERHYEAGFDVVAITDHGTVDYGWSSPIMNKMFIGKVMKTFGRTDFKLDYLGESGSFANGMTYNMVKKGNDDYLVTGDGKEILRIPYGIENNAVSVNAHVNSWFVDFHNNLPCDYADAVRGVDKAGGISIINHPGEYSTARYELFTKDAYDLSNPSYKYFFQKIYGLINKYDSCLGIDINSKGDGRTRFDRKLWDLMLAEAGKSGKTVYAIASSDAHQTDKIDTGCTIVLAKDKTSEAIKNSMKKGEFFASSTCISNCEELTEIANSIKELYGETPLYNELIEVITKYNAERDALNKKAKKSNTGVSYRAIDDNGYFNKSSRPEISSINVDDTENTITVNSKNASIIRWISNGKVIATTKTTDNTIDLDEYASELGDYVRAEVFGEGGIMYTQSFTLNAEQKTEKKYFSINLGMFDFLINDIDMVFGLLVRGIKGLFN
ncbi:MAG: hypothetical protein KBT46_05090, partial [Ruminococcus sp.]|nr:hypothetical protein [Candidatus Copronaster equi]